MVLLALIAAAAYVLARQSGLGGRPAAAGQGSSAGSGTRGGPPGAAGPGATSRPTGDVPRTTVTARAPVVTTGTTLPLPGTTSTTPRPVAFPIGSASMQVAAQTPAGPVTVPVALYYPALSQGPGAAPDQAHGPYPLVVFSQGFGEHPSAYTVLIDTWAHAGFVVAAPTYTHTDPGPGLWRPDIVNHPAELSATITAVLHDSSTPGGLLSGMVRPARVAVAGQSDGGDVSLAAAVNSCCRDPRIKAAVILSGAEYSVFGGSYYSQGSPPLLVTQGDRDSAALGNAPVCSANLYNAAPAPKYYLDLLGATHLPPYTQLNPWEAVVAKVSVEFLDAYLLGQHGQVLRMSTDGNVAGVSTITSAPTVPSPGGTC